MSSASSSASHSILNKLRVGGLLPRPTSTGSVGTQESVAPLYLENKSPSSPRDFLQGKMARTKLTAKRPLRRHPWQVSSSSSEERDPLINHEPQPDSIENKYMDIENDPSNDMEVEDDSVNVGMSYNVDDDSRMGEEQIDLKGKKPMMEDFDRDEDSDDANDIYGVDGVEEVDEDKLPKKKNSNRQDDPEGSSFSPYTIKVRKRWVDTLNHPGNLETYSEVLDLPRSGLSIIVPKPGQAITDAPEGTLPVYKETLDIGLRFPPPEFIMELCAGYEIGLCQLTPNSWCHIMGYMGACLVQKLKMTFDSFAFMHTLAKLPKCLFGWFSIANKDPFMTTESKLNKQHVWKSEFVFIDGLEKELVKILGRINIHPPECIGKNYYPQLTDGETKLTEWFTKRTMLLRPDKLPIQVPKNWLPMRHWLYDRNFLISFGFQFASDKEIGIIISSFCYNDYLGDYNPSYALFCS